MNKLTRFSSSMMLAIALAACQSTQIDTSSQITLPKQFPYAQGSAQIANWWNNWHDSVLNELIEQGLQTSPDILIALSKLNEASAQARLAKADLGTKVQLNGRAGYTRGNVDNPIDSRLRHVLSHMPHTGALSSDSIDLNGGTLLSGVGVSWEPDIFGAKRSDADAAKAVALAESERLAGARLLIASRLAEYYFQARAIQAQQRIVSQSISELKKLLRYTQERFRAGHVTQYEVEQVKSELTAMQARQTILPAQYQANVRAIAVLVGKVPQDFRLPESATDVLAHSAAAPAGLLPSELLWRRPDLRAKAAVVQAYAAKLASAKADLYPRFSIQFLGQGLRMGLTGEDALNGWGGLITAGISVPLFTNGRIEANIQAADARLQTALLEYDRALLQALAEVDNAYQTTQQMAQQNQLKQQNYMQHVRRANNAQKLFRYGNKTLDTVIQARLSQYEIAADLVLGQLAYNLQMLNIYKALGGGW